MSGLLRRCLLTILVSIPLAAYAGYEDPNQNQWDQQLNQCGDPKCDTTACMDAYVDSCYAYLNTTGCVYQGTSVPTIYLKEAFGPDRVASTGRHTYTQKLHCTDSTDALRFTLDWQRPACKDADEVGDDSAGDHGICVERLEADRWKLLTNAACTPRDGNPCDAATGNKIIQETDFEGVGLHFYRTWHSFAPKNSSPMGSRWVHSYGDYLDIDALGYPIAVITPDGYYMTLEDTSGGVFIAPDKAGIRGKQSGTDWAFEYPNGEVRSYDSNGRLDSVEVSPGQTTSITYDANGRVDEIIGPFGHKLRLTYSGSTGKAVYLYWPDNKKVRYSHQVSNGNYRLYYVNLPQGKRYYQYNDSNHPDFITNIKDELGNIYATYTYDASTGKVLTSEHAGAAGKVTLSYSADSTTVTDGDGRTKTYNFVDSPFTGRRLVSTDRNSTSASRTFGAPGSDALQRLATKTDAAGNVTAYGYDDHHRTTVTEAHGTLLARTTSYEFLRPDSNLIKKVIRPSLHSANNAETVIAYNSMDLPTSITESGYDSNGNAISRTTSFTYNTYGQILTIDGPRADVSDITTFTYHTCTTGSECGQIASITNPAGHVTTYNTYDAAGRLTKETGPNGYIREYTYNWKGHLYYEKRRSPYNDYKYYYYYFNDAGLPTLIPEGPYSEGIRFTYDDAHRVTEVKDDEGNKIKYEYDSAGNTTKQTTEDSAGNLKRQVDYTYDSWSRLDTINRGGSVTDVLFDALGNLEETEDPNLNTTEHIYDALNRLTDTVDAANNTTYTAYDEHDNLTQVTAPNNAATTYVYDDLGRIESEVSSDRGTTTYSYDSVGNVLTKTDARGITATYTYDALNRVTSISYPTPGKNVTFGYDSGANNKGLLTSMTDESGSTTWNHFIDGPSARERSMTKTQVTGGVTLTTTYVFDSLDGRLKSMTYPSGTSLSLSYSNQYVEGLTFAGTSLLSNATYDPFGPVTGWTWGNSSTFSITYNTEGEATSHSIGTNTRTNTFDAASRLLTQSDSEYNLTYGYDTLDRVSSLSASPQNGGTTLPSSQGFTYDANGNRASITENSIPYSYANQANSNRLSSTAGPVAKTMAYDSAGNITGDGTNTFVYDDRGRLSSVNSGATTYQYNALGERTRKSSGGNATLYVYGLNGEILGEYDGTGSAIQENAWLQGRPIAAKQGSSVYYVYSDHLGTPRAVSSGNTIVWRWDSDPFGSTSPDQDPDGDLNSFTYNLRFPGQYYDSETGLHYNYFRTYDPSTGRYLESDPIGLAGGLNTYGYALQNPLRYTDPTGENPLTLPAAGTIARECLRNGLCAGTVGAATGVALGCVLNPSLCNSIVTEACADASDAIDDLLKPFLNEDKKLTPGEIKKLKGKGIDPEALKGGKATGKLDLFKDKKGNIKIKPKDGSGPGEPTGININDL